MPLFKTAWSVFADALFPIPEAERRVLAMDAEAVFKELPRAKPAPVPEACSIFAYKDNRVWRLIWSIKYKRSSEAAAIAGHALFKVLRLYSIVMPRIIVIPMPITKLRRRERGFNQCELIADEIEKLDRSGGRSTDEVGDRRLSIVRDLLIRRKHTSRQTLKGRAERLASVRNIFAVNNEAIRRITGSDPSLFARATRSVDGNADTPPTNPAKDCFVVVIDDVITTGGTIKDAVETLRRAGFENTWGLSVAH